jgi:endonuclease-3
MARIALPEVVERLEAHYGKPRPPWPTDAWEMVLWVNAVYMADDDRRREAFQTLKKQVGTDAARILAAPDEALLEVTRHGIVAELSAAKLRQCARILLEQFDGDLGPTLRLPFAKARKALQKFPGIGEPGAETILLFSRSFPVLGLDSNGLRVLVRLGFAEEAKNYAATYRLVRQALAAELREDYPWLTRAHLLLRRHGQELCKRNGPACEECPLAPQCAYYRQL